MIKRLIAILVLLCIALISWPTAWYPATWRLQFANWFGVPGYQPLPQVPETAPEAKEPICPEDVFHWRDATTVEGVPIQKDLQCSPDMPEAIAAFVKGTNNVSTAILMKTGLAPDAVEKGKDLDGDGDPDEIHIRLEVVELNGPSPDNPAPTTQFAIAPGITPGLWVFAPKTLGMATENFESRKARWLLRLPSPAIRIEQGDHVQITLENSHYMPHTIHFHGVDHPFVDDSGEGNDGVPLTSELPVQPGQARTYELSPRHAGTMFYHCHVQPQVHAMMGLEGLFIVEENRPNNWVQTLNIGDGLVRAPSVAVRESFDREYDFHYLDIDRDLNDIIQQSNDPRIVNHELLREYNPTQARSEYFTLNGHSFPYTFRESLLVTKPDETIKMRVLNGGSVGVALHTHGHKVTTTDLDGVAVKPGAQITRDVVWIAPAQRADLALQTTNDGLHSYGSGIWLLHDHQPAGVTTDGIGPGGNVSAIVYEDFLQPNGWPRTQGEEWGKFFSPQYYQRDDSEKTRPGVTDNIESYPLILRLLVVGLALGGIVALLLFYPRKS